MKSLIVTLVTVASVLIGGGCSSDGVTEAGRITGVKDGNSYRSFIQCSTWINYQQLTKQGTRNIKGWSHVEFEYCDSCQE